MCVARERDVLDVARAEYGRRTGPELRESDEIREGLVGEDLAGRGRLADDDRWPMGDVEKGCGRTGLQLTRRPQARCEGGKGGEGGLKE